MTVVDRSKLIARLAAVLSQSGCPRRQMTCIVLATGLAGFLASVLLLRLGMVDMWLRYPLAVAASYGVFLLLMKIWISWHRRALTEDLANMRDLDTFEVPPDDVPVRSVVRSDRDDSWMYFMPEFDLEDSVVLIMVLLALGGAVIASVWIVWVAPWLLGEVVLDAIVIAGLRRRMVRLAVPHWSWGVVRRTAIPFALVALIFSLAGATLHQIRPSAGSIGAVFRAEPVDLR